MSRVFFGQVKRRHLRQLITDLLHRTAARTPVRGARAREPEHPPVRSHPDLKEPCSLTPLGLPVLGVQEDLERGLLEEHVSQVKEREPAVFFRLIPLAGNP